MGDRCTCTLYLKAPATPELLELIEEHLGTPDWTSEDQLWRSFEEINYAELPSEIQEHLVATGIVFGWANGSGGDYPEGVILFDGTTLSEWVTNQGEIMLSITATNDPVILAEAIAAQAFFEEL